MKLFITFLGVLKSTINRNTSPVRKYCIIFFNKFLFYFAYTLITITKKFRVGSKNDKIFANFLIKEIKCLGKL